MRSMRGIQKNYEVAVVGGGLAGVCAALAAARHGARTVVIQSRSVFGGNSSSEIRMHVAGATCHFGKKDVGETGIIMELLLENKKRNAYHSFSIWDSVLWEKVKFQENLDCCLNTFMLDAHMDGDRIKSIACCQMTTESLIDISAEVFIDATGNGTLGYLSGADYCYGSEARGEFHEPDAPVKSNQNTMGNSIMFMSRDMGELVKFQKPFWAYSFSDKELAFRGHGNQTMYHGANGITEEYCADSGYWWIELGGSTGDVIGKSEAISDELNKVVYGIWDHIKNGGSHGAENYALEWVGSVAGIRESRRLVGDYMLNENDILANRVFSDAVAYGGWPMDEHVPEGVFSPEKPTRFINFPGIYSIPYRCYYSRNIENLMMAGRDISVTKMALGSTRVMATCAVGGQAAGTAAAMAVRYGVSPRGVGRHMEELQQALLKDDCYIPGIKNQDSLDLGRRAIISADSYTPGNEPGNVLSGVARTVPGENGSNMWESEPLGEKGAALTLRFPQSINISQIRITFDPNLSQEIMTSMTKTVQLRQPKSLPPELVKDYVVTLYAGENQAYTQAVSSNAQRLNVLNLPRSVRADRLTINVLKTYGLERARIFEVRVYEKEGGESL